MADRNHQFEDDTLEPTYLQGDEHHSDEDDTKSSTHPFVTYNSLASSRVEAGPSFVNAYFAKHHNVIDPLAAPPGTQTPDMGRTSPSTNSGPAAAAMIKCRQGFESGTDPVPTTPLSIRVSQQMKEEHKDTMPQILLQDAKTQTTDIDITEKKGDPDVDDDTTSRKIEDEIRNMMRKGWARARRSSSAFGDTLVKCMELRDKQENPKNKSGWKIYPKPPPPAWHNFSHKSPEDQPEEFDMGKCEIPPEDEAVFEMGEDGIYAVYRNEELRAAGQEPFTKAPSIKEFYMDMDYLLNAMSDGPIKTWAFRRLRYLDARWQLYVLLNEREETTQSKMVPHRDLYNVRKVDGHVHLASAMNQKHLLRFINRNRPVIVRDGQTLTLRQVFESLKLTAIRPGAFHRFDKFNLKYNPSDNFIDGEYFAQITREVMSDLEQSKYQMAEYRISIYGRSIDEWDKLAAWVVDHKVFSSNVENFEQVLRNIFQPLFEVTKDPKLAPQAARLFAAPKPERRMHKKYPLPRVWDSSSNPPYTYYCYFTMANLCSLNQWRMRRGFNTFVTWQPAFLTAQAINHGILLRKVPVLQYLYYMQQIGLAMSPLAIPFNTYFQRGLNVALSTDDPLQFHFTKEPLMEEYSVAAQIWKFSSVDMCELAMNSVIQSGFEAETEVHKTNVPLCRLKYRAKYN
ncbi:hypothetical protein DL89DRAFT_290596 [Linderina pennispora]|uniref:AMP deaminase n=1 Tax=Linderina pennispora TaxID=61395 RepID=A0A1Y1WGS8_9FUNG|nr:uncharacterized protein DL89DRAFT_290596 [Linderina pennispora]ORX72761.1 hypothetical protein DL89DRAFT_290596 [Linderina pennispora]